MKCRKFSSNLLKDIKLAAGCQALAELQACCESGRAVRDWTFRLMLGPWEVALRTCIGAEPQSGMLEMPGVEFQQVEPALLAVHSGPGVDSVVI